MTTKTKILIIVSVFLVGGAIGRFSLPSKIVEKEKIVYQDKVVIQKVEVESTMKKNNKVYTRTEVINKDGSKTSTTKIEDKSVTDKDTTTQTDKDKESSTVTEKSKETTYAKESIVFGPAVKTNLTQFSLPSYGGFVDARIISVFHITAQAFTDGTVTIGAGIGF